MIINISSIFSEPEINFKVSWKVYKLLMQRLTALNVQVELPKNSKRDCIGFMLSTRKDNTEIKVWEPKLHRGSRFIHFDVMLPYLEITDENEYLSIHLDHLKEACKTGFSQLGVTEYDLIDSEFANVKKEVMGNSEYRYVKRMIEMPAATSGLPSALLRGGASGVGTAVGR